MESESKLVQKADFNPRIKTYILLVVAFFLVISIAGIPLLIIWFLGLGQYISRRYYNNLTCQLTTHHLQFKKGVLFKVEKTIPLENIQDLTFIENPLLDFLDLKILKIETAGNSNPRGSDMKLMGIVEAQEFKKLILNQREALSRSKTKDQEGSSLNQNQVVDLLTEIRDLLKK